MKYPTWCKQVLTVEEIGWIMRYEIEVANQNQEAANSTDLSALEGVTVWEAKPSKAKSVFVVVVVMLAVSFIVGCCRG